MSSVEHGLLEPTQILSESFHSSHGHQSLRALANLSILRIPSPPKLLGVAHLLTIDLTFCPCRGILGEPKILLGIGCQPIVVVFHGVVLEHETASRMFEHLKMNDREHSRKFYSMRHFLSVCVWSIGPKFSRRVKLQFYKHGICSWRTWFFGYTVKYTS
jgi:hypothetical protein